MEPTKSFTDSSANLIQVRKEIHAKWNKFSEQEISVLKSKDDLVTKVMATYSLDKTLAQRDVDGLLKGRSF